MIGSPLTNHPAIFARFIFTGFQEFFDLGTGSLQFFDLFLLTLNPVLILLLDIAVVVFLEDMANGLVQLAFLASEISVGATPLFARIAGQFAAINGKHLTPNQALRVTDHEHLQKELGDFFAGSRDKVSYRGEMGLGIGRERHKNDILTA